MVCKVVDLLLTDERAMVGMPDARQVELGAPLAGGIRVTEDVRERAIGLPMGAHQLAKGLPPCVSDSGAPGQNRRWSQGKASV